MKPLILIGIVFVIVLISGCVQTEGNGGKEVRALKNLNAVSDIINPSSINGETVEFKIEALKVIDPKHYFRIILPEGVEYVSGDFKLNDENELILEPIGKLGYNYQGDYLGKDAESRIMQLDKTEYNFTLRGISTGKHRIFVETDEKNTTKLERFVEIRHIDFCTADTLEEASRICTQIDTECTTEECIKQRTEIPTVILINETS